MEEEACKHIVEEEIQNTGRQLREYVAEEIRSMNRELRKYKDWPEDYHEKNCSLRMKRNEIGRYI